MKTIKLTALFIASLCLLLMLTLKLQAQDYYYNYSNSVTITKYLGTATEVIIPDTLNGSPVTGIGDYAFAYCTNVTRITVPDSVTCIGIEAFASCTQLIEIIIRHSTV
jgi:hypothetical protein